jgi:hypothetical protein
MYVSLIFLAEFYIEEFFHYIPVQLTFVAPWMLVWRLVTLLRRNSSILRHLCVNFLFGQHD